MDARVVTEARAGLVVEDPGDLESMVEVVGEDTAPYRETRSCSLLLEEEVVPEQQITAARMAAVAVESGAKTGDRLRLQHRATIPDLRPTML